LDSAIVRASDRDGPPLSGFRRFTLALAGFVVLPPIFLAAFVLVVDPYYVFGSPSLPGINTVRPYYELHVLAAKPYQVQRIKPAAVSLGSSRVEVGLDPRHPGWANRNVFNFGLPSATSYEVMLAFLHARTVGQPLKQAVVGLDFFGFNIFFPRNQEQQEARFADNGSQAFADFLATEVASRPHGISAADPVTAQTTGEAAWNELLYLRLHPGVAAAVRRGTFISGYQHYVLAGRAEGRESGMVPSNWNETLYLNLHPDVASEVQRGKFLSGYHHYLVAGRAKGYTFAGQLEGRENNLSRSTATAADRRASAPAPRLHPLVSPVAEPPDVEAWNEAIYLAIHPDVAAAVARQEFKSGHEHYLLAGRAEGRESGMAPSNWNDALYLKLNPDVAAEVQRGTFQSAYHHFLANGQVEGRESGLVPSNWNEAQYLKIYPDVAAEVRRGTFLSGYHHYLAAGRAEGRADGTPPNDWNEAQYLRMYPDVAAEVQRGTFLSGYHHYLTAGRREGRNDGTPPPDWNEALYLRLYPDVAAEMKRGTFVSGYHHYLVAGRAEGRNNGKTPSDWNEQLYLRVNPDVQREVTRGTFLSGYHHYLVNGRSERREGGTVPRDWDEVAYLQINPDVQYHITQGYFLSGYHHYLVAGRAEKRSTGGAPAGWNEAEYLAANPAARARIALGDYRNGYVHYAAVGRNQGLLGGLPPGDVMERLRLRWPALNKAMFQFGERFRLIFSTTAVHDSIATVFRQSDPPSFDDRGMRVWAGEDEIAAAAGGAGQLFRKHLAGWRWYLWLMPPRFMYCFTNTETGMTAFDPYRFMLRQAYIEGIDLRLYVTPLNAAVRKLMQALGLGERYKFWISELTRINEEEAARAGHEPLTLWDFSDVNAITGEVIPAPADPTAMRWFRDYSHYRRVAGDLILDRVLDHTEAERNVPADFGVRLTAENVDAHLARGDGKLADWTSANAELASQIVAAAQSPKAETRQAQAACW
jgi:hypothetical protein